MHYKRNATQGYMFRCVWFEEVTLNNKPYTQQALYRHSDNTDDDWITQECVICPVAMSVADRTKKMSGTKVRVYELHIDTQEIIANSLQGIRYS